MPPKRKRKAAAKPTADEAASTTTRSKRGRKATATATTSKSTTKSKAKTTTKKQSSPPKPKIVTPEMLFDEICNTENPNMVDMDGIVTLCEKYLDIDPYEDIRVLVLMWKLGSKEKPASISRKEWLGGCQKHHITSDKKLKAFVPSLDTGFLDRSEFKDFYKFVFTFNLEGTLRTLDTEMVGTLMTMVLGEGGRVSKDRLETFVTFVQAQKSYTRITLDQWTSFLDFCYEVDDLSTYDDSVSAWPVLIDEYVDYMEEQQKKK